MARTPDPAVRVSLIEAAAELLAREGIDALSIRRVATSVGTSTMAVYTHFGSKDVLVQEVVREGFGRLHAELTTVPTSTDPATHLVDIAQAYRRNALANPHLYRVMFGLNPLALTDPAEAQDTEEAGTALGLDAFGALVDAVARCVDHGVLAGDPGHLALQVWATAHGAVALELAGFLGDDAEAVFTASTAATFAGLPRP